MVAALLVILISVGHLPAQSVDDFDPSPANFGGNGVVSSVALQADGKILVGGAFMTLGGQPCNNIGRLNADGSPDSSFNPWPDGCYRYPGVSSLAVQADGKILVGGDFRALGGQPRDAIGRLNPDGSLDSTFDPGG